MIYKLLTLVCLLPLCISRPEKADLALATPPPTTQPDIKHGEKCTTGKEEEGKCTAYYQCKISETTDETAGLIDIHLPRVVCESYIDVCCALKDISSTPLP